MSAALAHLAPTVVIRAARGSDGPALRRLAELDSRPVPGRGPADRRDPATRSWRRCPSTPARASPTRSAARRTSSTCWPTARGGSGPRDGDRAASARSILHDRAEAAPPWKIWTALWIVYIVWGSTYLAIALMVETIPPLLGAGARFIAVGLILLPILAWRNAALSVLPPDARASCSPPASSA